MSVIEMPKTMREQLDELRVNGNILIEQSKRWSWGAIMSAFHRDTRKQFTIRKQPGTNEIRIWRLK